MPRDHEGVLTRVQLASGVHTSEQHPHEPLDIDPGGNHTEPLIVNTSQGEGGGSFS